MANSISWGKVYCHMVTNESWGVDIIWSANAVNHLSAPPCWRITADNAHYTADTTILTADLTHN